MALEVNEVINELSYNPYKGGLIYWVSLELFHRQKLVELVGWAPTYHWEIPTAWLWDCDFCFFFGGKANHRTPPLRTD